MRYLGLVCLLAAGAAPPALAGTDVVFNGSVTDTCTLAVPTAGTMTLSADGTTLGSDQTLGLPATVTVISIGANTITLSAPALVSHPPGYTAGEETVQMNYSGLASHPAYTSAQQSFGIGLLPLASLIVNMQVVNSSGFAAGDYTAKTVLTCS